MLGEMSSKQNVYFLYYTSTSGAPFFREKFLNCWHASLSHFGERPAGGSGRGSLDRIRL